VESQVRAASPAEFFAFCVIGRGGRRDDRRSPDAGRVCPVHRMDRVRATAEEQCLLAQRPHGGGAAAVVAVVLLMDSRSQDNNAHQCGPSSYQSVHYKLPTGGRLAPRHANSHQATVKQVLARCQHHRRLDRASIHGRSKPRRSCSRKCGPIVRRVTGANGSASTCSDCTTSSGLRQCD
jgi:hypothetical protein